MRDSPFIVRFLRLCNVDVRELVYERPHHLSEGTVVLGITKNFLRLPVVVSVDDVLRHCLIVGSTGSGKTSLAKRLARLLSRHGAVVVLDWYGEYCDVADRVIRIGREEPVEIPVEDPLDVVSLLEEVLELTPPQSYLLTKVLRKTSNVEFLLDLLESYVPEARWEIETKASLLRKLSFLVRYGKLLRIAPPEKLNSTLLSRGNCVSIDLSSLRVLELKRLAVLSTLNSIRYIQERKLFDGRVFVIVEEAHNVASRGDLLARYLAEVRKLNMGLIVITQSPAALGFEAMNNTNIKVVKTLRSAEDIQTIARSMNLSSDRYSLLSRLGFDEAIVDAPSLSEPILVELSEIT
jgi:DNA helicase HerA-like ATPase